MSDEDRERWNLRYQNGEYEQRLHPSTLLAAWSDRLPRGRALDVACGAGRNSRFLNALGYAVTAIDISASALARLADVPNITVIAHDLDSGLPSVEGEFDLIIKMRFLKIELLPALIDRLNPGGVLVCEVLLQGSSSQVGPDSPRFRAAPGVLRAAAKGLLVMHDYEGDVVDPDGRSVHVAQLIARKPTLGL